MKKSNCFFCVFFCAILIMISFGNTNAFENSGLFSPYWTYKVFSRSEAVAIGDVNDDGRNDVVMATSTGFYPDSEDHYCIFVFLQNPSGELELPPIRYEASNEYGAGNGESVDIGDLNNDGRADVVVTSRNGIGVFLQNGSSWLDPLDPMITHPSSTLDPYKVRIGDFNNDGRFDVVSIYWGSRNQPVDVLLQNEQGELDTLVTYRVIHAGYDDLEVGDLNNDGLQDIVVMSGQSYNIDNIGVLLQNFDGFDSPAYYDLGTDSNTNGMAVGDVNNDFLEDIVVSYGGNDLILPRFSKMIPAH